MPTVPVYARHRAFKAPFAIDQMAIIYFELQFEEDNAVEDYENNLEEIKEDDHEKYNFLVAYDANKFAPTTNHALYLLEDEAIKAVEKLFAPLRVGNQGHNHDGSLNMWISVNSYQDVEKVEGILSDNHTGGEDNIDVGVMYYEARDFMFYPQGVNGPLFGPEYHSNHHDYQGEIWEWLDLHKHIRNKKP